MKKLMLVFILLVLFIPNICHGFDEWILKDIERQVAVSIVHGIDWLQTREIARNDKFYERNPIMGKYPSKKKVDLYMGLSLLGKLGIVHILRQEHRKYAQYFFFGVSSGLVVHNYIIGVRIRF